MTDELVIVKKELVDEAEYGVMSPEVKENGAREDSDTSADMVSPVPPNTVGNYDTRNFTCLLCDVMYDSRDDLRKHLKTVHASKHGFVMNNSIFTNQDSSSASSLGAFSSHVNYRYTCTICGAKFKTFRSYISHNVSHRTSSDAISRADETRMAVLFGTGKYLQDYIDSEDGYAATFTCDGCNAVFLQRDAYAMHMMMKAMNETCQPVIMTQSAPPEATVADEKNASSTISDNSEKSEHIEINEKSNGSSHGKYSNVSPSTAQRCLEDVTSTVDQDEYLKSVLDKVFVKDDSKSDQYDSHLRQAILSADDRKICTFCGNGFADQDSLAMHVMSDHSEQMTFPNRRKSARAAKGNEYAWHVPSQMNVSDLKCKFCGETFFSRDNLAMHLLTHTQLEGRDGDLGSPTARVYNALKRRHDFDSEISSSAAERIKLLRLRTIRRFNELSAKQNHMSVGVTHDRDTRTLYCVTCKVHFRTASEMDWHRCTPGSHLASNDEPLCLTKSAEKSDSDITTNSEDQSSEEAKDPVSRTRRNSFSVTSNTFDPVPTRPLSVGDSSTFTGVAFKREDKVLKPKRDDTPPNHGDTATSSKEMNISAIVPSVNALSTHEQRIIYSVFGKDLGLNKLHTTSVTSSLSEENDNIKKQRKDKTHDVQTAPSDLSLPRSRSRPSSASGSINGVLDEYPRPPSTSKESTICKYCDIIFLNKAIYYLHMGLHNVNNPWQCNVCGHVCKDAVDFAAHVIHM